MKRSHHRRTRSTEQAELDITAFMNLMVVLVPILLISAVFSKMTIIELALPDGRGGSHAPAPERGLEVAIHRDAIEVRYGRDGLHERIPRTTRDVRATSGRDTKQEADLKLLRATLKQVKARHPDLLTATVRSEPDTPYDTLVRVIDTVRTFPARRNGRSLAAELFPDIVIADAKP